MLRVVLALAVAAPALVAGVAPQADPSRQGGAAQRTAANRPTVARSTPRTGDAGLDPSSVKELRVVFDQPMARTGLSFTGGGPTFPKVNGKPRFTDAMTAVLPVELAPDTDYLVGVNSADFTNFRSADGKRAAIPKMLVFSTREWPIDDAMRARAVARLRALLPAAYSYASRLDVDWPARLDAFEPRLAAAGSELELAVLVQELMDVAEDPHVWTRIGDADFMIPSEWRVRRSATRNLRPNIDRRGLSAEIERLGGTVEWHVAQILTFRPAPKVGYLLVPTWDRSASPGAAAVSALEALDGVESLIIDVRDNGGGDELQARRFASCFTAETVAYAKRRVLRDGELGPVYTAMLEPAESGERFDGRVIVLVGPSVMSSNEAFVLMMRASGAQLIGETTLGSSGNPAEHRITGNIRLWLPSWIAMDAEGEPFEGVGIAPDIEVAFDRTQARREDLVLRRAVEILSDR